MRVDDTLRARRGARGPPHKGGTAGVDGHGFSDGIRRQQLVESDTARRAAWSRTINCISGTSGIDSKLARKS